jgi:hypothetical protein
VSVFVFSSIVSGCGSGSSPSTPPANPVFTSVLVANDDEATLYSYQPAATSPDGSTVGFSLAQSNACAVPQRKSARSRGPGHRDPPVVPLIGPVQARTINGSSIFQSSSLNTTALNFAWPPPPGTTPNGYYRTVFSLRALPTGAVQYIFVGRFGTAKTPLPSRRHRWHTYVFVITAQINAAANIETSPYRSQLPSLTQVWFPLRSPSTPARLPTSLILFIDSD